LARTGTVEVVEFNAMVLIRFPDDAAKRRALGWLPGRFSFKSWADGKMLVPEAALAALASVGIPFIFEGATVRW
jgi:hypothetical protein